MHPHPRFELSGRAFIHNDQQIFIAPLLNICRGGAFIGKLVSLPIGSRVKVVIKISSLTAPLQFSGKVVRVESSDRVGSAIQFDNDLERLL